MGEGLRCRFCFGALHLFPDSTPLLMYCEEGHFQSLDELLDQQLPADVARPPEVLALWERRSATLYLLAGRTLALGHTLLAANLQEAAVRIDARLAEIRSLSPEAGGFVLYRDEARKAGNRRLADAMSCWSSPSGTRRDSRTIA